MIARVADNHWIKGGVKMDPDRLFQYGLPTVLLAFLCWAVWRAIVWTGHNLAVPVRDRALSHLDKVDVALGRLADTLDRMETLQTGCRLPIGAACVLPTNTTLPPKLKPGP